MLFKKIFKFSHKASLYSAIFCILFIVIILIKIITIMIFIKSDLEKVLNNIKQNYSITLSRVEQKSKDLIALLELATHNLEQEYLLKSCNLLEHDDYLYLSFIKTQEQPNLNWVYVRQYQNNDGLNVYQKTYPTKLSYNLAAIIDVEALSLRLLRDNYNKFFNVKFYPINKNVYQSSLYFDIYYIEYSFNMLEVLKYIAQSFLSLMLMLICSFVLVLFMQLKYRKFYLKKTTSIINDLKNSIEQLEFKIMDKDKSIINFNAKINALNQTNQALDCFAKDFVLNLIKTNDVNVYEQGQIIQNQYISDISEQIVFANETISSIIDESLSYHARAIVDNNHKFSVSIANNIVIPARNVFGFKKVLISCLQYLLSCSPSDVNFELIINGAESSNLDIKIVEVNTFSFIKEQNSTNNTRLSRKFTDLFCLTWQELTEMSKIENIFLDKEYKNKNRYIFIKAQLDSNNRQLGENVYSIY